MNRKLLFDSHVHSDNSPDGEHSVTYLGLHAAEHGLGGFAVTDHCECNAYYSDHYDKSTFQSFFETQKTNAIMGGQLCISAGVELGQPMQAPDVARRVVEEYAFDFVLCSVHNVRNSPDFYFLDYNTTGISGLRELLMRYFDELLESADKCDYDSLAHITYPYRYIIGQHGIQLDTTRYQSLIDEVLRVLSRRDKALEVNTSGLRGPLGTLLPELDIFQRFKALGGRYVTIGSDAHVSADIGKGFDEAFAMLRKAGFTQYAFYRERKPVLIDIPTPQEGEEENNG